MKIVSIKKMENFPGKSIQDNTNSEHSCISRGRGAGRNILPINLISSFLTKYSMVVKKEKELIMHFVWFSLLNQILLEEKRLIKAK